MKAMRVILATCVVVLATSSVAKANLVLVNGTTTASFIDLTAQGFGNAPRLLTLQDSPYEIGSVTPQDVVHDGAIAGSNKSTTPVLSALGWTSGAQVGIGFNTNQTGSSDGITLQTLTLTLYNGTTSVGSFSLAAPINFNAADLTLQQGNGNAVFNFGLDAAQQVTFNGLLTTYGAGLYAGLASSLGCQTPTAGCFDSNDGADSFVGFAQGHPTTVPDGGMTLMLLGGALFGLAVIRRRFAV